MIKIRVYPDHKLGHLETASEEGDTELFKAGVISYNDAVADIAQQECIFCSGAGHLIAECPLRITLAEKWKGDPVRTLVFARICSDLRDEHRKPLNM